MKEWIVPVVVLIVWVVSTILKSRENAEPVRKPPAGDGGRKPTGDIDKFLQEIDRLRKKSAEEQVPTVRPAPPVRPVRPVPRVRAANRARPVKLTAEPVVVEAVPAVTPARQRLALTADPVTTQPSAVAQVSVVELRRSPGVAAAMNMLRSPRSMSGAVVLQEVLGPPKCKRRRS